MGRLPTDISFIENAVTRMARTTKRTLGLLKSCAVLARRSGWHVAAFVRDERGRRFVFSSVKSDETVTFARASLQHFDAITDLYTLTEDVETARTTLCYKSLARAMNGRVLPTGVGGGDGADDFPAPKVVGGGGGGGEEEAEEAEDEEAEHDGRRGAIALTVIENKAARVMTSQRRACSLLKNALIIASIAHWHMLVVVQDETGRRLVSSSLPETTPPQLFVSECTRDFVSTHDIYYETDSLKDSLVLLSINNILAANRSITISLAPAAPPLNELAPAAPPLNELAAAPPLNDLAAAPALTVLAEAPISMVVTSPSTTIMQPVPAVLKHKAAVRLVAAASSLVVLAPDSMMVVTPPIITQPAPTLLNRKAAAPRDDDDVPARSKKLKLATVVEAAPPPKAAARPLQQQRIMIVFGRHPPGQQQYAPPPLTTSSHTINVVVRSSTLPSRHLSFARRLCTPSQLISYALDEGVTRRDNEMLGV